MTINDTLTTIQAYTDDELNDAIAVEVMGWTARNFDEATRYLCGYEHEHQDYCESKPFPYKAYLGSAPNHKAVFASANVNFFRAWNPAQDANHTRLALERLGKLVLLSDYAEHLATISNLLQHLCTWECGPDWGGISDLFLIGERQQCEAALYVWRMGEKG